jgi:hypothetical protein
MGGKLEDPPSFRAYSGYGLIPQADAGRTGNYRDLLIQDVYY